MKMVAGLFDSVNKLSAAVEDLRSSGYTDDDISIVSRSDLFGDDLSIENDVVQDIKDGAKKGGTIGAIVGLLVGVGVLTIPGVGALLIAGPMAAALGITGVAGTTVSGAITGALAGGLVAGLVELGIDDKTAEKYEEAVKSGKMLLSVWVGDDTDTSVIEKVMEKYDAEEVEGFNVKSN